MIRTISLMYFLRFLIARLFANNLLPKGRNVWRNLVCQRLLRKWNRSIFLSLSL